MTWPELMSSVTSGRCSTQPRANSAIRAGDSADLAICVCETAAPIRSVRFAVAARGYRPALTTTRTAGWSAVGSTFQHVVGFGPFRIPDGTEVLEIHDGEMLKLRVRARPLIWAVATFRVVGDDERCVVTMQEEPAARRIGNIVRPVMDPTMQVRNHRSLRRLAGVVESKVAPTRGNVNRQRDPLLRPPCFGGP